MQEPAVLSLSSPLAAAQISLALWSSQVFIALLRAEKPAVVGHALVALLTMITSTIAWQAKSLDRGWQTCWLIAGLLAAIMLVVMVSRWIGQGSTPTRNSHNAGGRHATGFIIPMTIAVTGIALSLAALGQSQASQILAALPPAAAWLNLAVVAVMFGITIASTLELTAGETGPELLALPWQYLSLPAGIAFLIQIGLGMLVIARLKPAETPIETMVPVIYSFGMLLLSYIAWCIPRRMQVLVTQKATTGQASLALSGWISLLCFALAAAIK